MKLLTSLLFAFFEEYSDAGSEVVKVVLKFPKRPKGMHLILEQINYPIEKHVFQNQRNVVKRKGSANESNLSTASFTSAKVESVF